MRPKTWDNDFRKKDLNQSCLLYSYPPQNIYSFCQANGFTEINGSFTIHTKLLKYLDELHL